MELDLFQKCEEFNADLNEQNDVNEE